MPPTGPVSLGMSDCWYYLCLPLAQSVLVCQTAATTCASPWPSQSWYVRLLELLVPPTGPVSLGMSDCCNYLCLPLAQSVLVCQTAGTTCASHWPSQSWYVRLLELLVPPTGPVSLGMSDCWNYLCLPLAQSVLVCQTAGTTCASHWPSQSWYVRLLQLLVPPTGPVSLGISDCWNYLCLPLAQSVLVCQTAGTTCASHWPSQSWYVRLLELLVPPTGPVSLGMPDCWNYLCLPLAQSVLVCQTAGTTCASHWPSQSWYVRLLELLVPPPGPVSLGMSDCWNYLCLPPAQSVLVCQTAGTTCASPWPSQSWYVRLLELLVPPPGPVSLGMSDCWNYLCLPLAQSVLVCQTAGTTCASHRPSQSWYVRLLELLVPPTGPVSLGMPDCCPCASHWPSQSWYVRLLELLVPPLAQSVLVCQTAGTTCASHWPSQSWYARLLSLCLPLAQSVLVCQTAATTCASHWPSQSWYVRLLQLLSLVDFCLILPLGKVCCPISHSHHLEPLLTLAVGLHRSIGLCPHLFWSRTGL